MLFQACPIMENLPARFKRASKNLRLLLSTSTIRTPTNKPTSSLLQQPAIWLRSTRKRRILALAPEDEWLFETIILDRPRFQMIQYLLFLLRMFWKSVFIIIFQFFIIYDLVFILKAIIAIELAGHAHSKKVWMVLWIAYVQKVVIFSRQIFERIKAIEAHSKCRVISIVGILLRRTMGWEFVASAMAKFYKKFEAKMRKCDEILLTLSFKALFELGLIWTNFVSDGSQSSRYFIMSIRRFKIWFLVFRCFGSWPLLLFLYSFNSMFRSLSFDSLLWRRHLLLSLRSTFVIIKFKYQIEDRVSTVDSVFFLFELFMGKCWFYLI